PGFVAGHRSPLLPPLTETSEVYRARDTRLGRDVALKILPAAFIADPDRIARFEHEAKLLAALNHPRNALGVRCPRPCCGGATQVKSGRLRPLHHPLRQKGGKEWIQHPAARIHAPHPFGKLEPSGSIGGLDRLTPPRWGLGR